MVDEIKSMTTIGSDTLVSANGYGGTKVPLPREMSSGTNTQGADPVPHLKHRHLPHFDLKDYYQFVTFRTFDSVDTFVKKIAQSNKSEKEKQQAVDDYLDSSTNGAYLKDDVLEWLFNFLLQQDKKLYELTAFAIMNNHVHILFKPLKPLSKVMQMIKGASSKQINELLGKSGKFWADDYYDKAIRDEKHFWVVYRYIQHNPLKIGGTEVPLPKEMLSGTDTSVSAKRDGGTEVPLPRETTSGTDTGSAPWVLVSENGKTLHVKRFYGMFE